MQEFSYSSGEKGWVDTSPIFLNAGTTAIVLVLVPFLPAALMQSKDAPLSKGGSNKKP